VAAGRAGADGTVGAAVRSSETTGGAAVGWSAVPAAGVTSPGPVSGFGVGTRAPGAFWKYSTRPAEPGAGRRSGTGTLSTAADGVRHCGAE
jgi:hypothetical protein